MARGSFNLRPPVRIKVTWRKPLEHALLTGVTLAPSGSGNNRSTESKIYIEFWDGAIWGAKIEVPFRTLFMKGVYGRQITSKIEMSNFDAPPEWLQLSIGGGDALAVGNVTVASAPARGESTSSKFEQKLDLNVGPAQWNAWDDYLVLIETRGENKHDGTENRIELEFYDINCNAIGQKLNISADMSKQSQGFYIGSIAPLSVTLPSPTFDR